MRDKNRGDTRDGVGDDVGDEIEGQHAGEHGHAGENKHPGERENQPASQHGQSDDALIEQDRHERGLIARAAQGDRAAFAELAQLKRTRIIRTARQITGHWEDAMDVAQIVLVKLWQGLERFDQSRKFDTWMYRVTVNAAIDMHRSQAPKVPLRPLPEPGEGREPASPDRGSEELVNLGQLHDVFQELAGDLAPQQRTAFILRDIEGLPTKEVAAILEVTDSTVRNHLMQARRTLRKGIEERYPELIPGGKKG